MTQLYQAITPHAMSLDLQSTKNIPKNPKTINSLNSFFSVRSYNRKKCYKTENLYKKFGTRVELLWSKSVDPCSTWWNYGGVLCSESLLSKLSLAIYNSLYFLIPLVEWHHWRHCGINFLKAPVLISPIGIYICNVLLFQFQSVLFPLCLALTVIKHTYCVKRSTQWKQSRSHSKGTNYR